MDLFLCVLGSNRIWLKKELLKIPKEKLQCTGDQSPSQPFLKIARNLYLYDLYIEPEVKYSYNHGENK